MCSPEHVAEVIAEDMVDLFLNAEFEVSQFPVSATILIDSLPQDTLLNIATYLYENIYRLSIPLGFFLLFLMPRKIPEDRKKSIFKEVTERLCNIRKDFSLRKTVEVKELNHDLPDAWEEIEVDDYRRILFLIENLNELRVPIYRGLGFDLFLWDNFLYRAYNFGTLRKPEWIYFRVKVKKQPRLNVFGHVREAEKVERVWVFENFSPEKIFKSLEREQGMAENLKSLEDKIKFVLARWEEFFGINIDKGFVAPTRSESASFPKEDTQIIERLKSGTKKYIMRLLEVV